MNYSTIRSLHNRAKGDGMDYAADLAEVSVLERHGSLTWCWSDVRQCFVAIVAGRAVDILPA